MDINNKELYLSPEVKTVEVKIVVAETRLHFKLWRTRQ